MKIVLKHFHMGKLHPLSSSMIVRSLEMKNDPFYFKEDNEEVLGSEIPYLCVIGAFIYLANYI